MKRPLTLILALAMALNLAAPAALASAFSDTRGHWAQDAIDRWRGYGVISGRGDGSFAPNATMTRAEMAQTYVNLLGLTEKADISAFSDVPADAWYADAVAKCVAAGILTGTSVTTLDPLSTVTREQVFVTFGRAMGIQPVETTNAGLADLEDVSGWASGMVNALLEAGYVSGMGDNTLQPGADINRASVMALMDKTVAVYANEAGATVETEGDGGLVLVAAADVTVTGSVGDVVVAPGAANGSVTLADATVTGTVTVNASAAQVSVSGASSVESVVVSEAAQGAQVSVEKNASVGTVSTAAEDTALTVSGKVEQVTVAETAGNATVSADKGAAVGSVTTAGSNTTVSGSGTVGKVEAAEGSTGATVTTPGTTVENNGSGSVTTDKGEVKPGGSGTTKPSGGSSGGGSAEPSVTAVNTVTTAILADTRTDGKVETLAAGYTVTAQKWSNKNYVDVTVAATDLAYHQNGNNAMGYWIGFAVTAPEGAAQMKVAFADSQDALILSDAMALEANVTSDGKSGAAFYASMGGAVKDWAQVQWLGGDGSALSTETYKMDLTGVTLKGVTTEAELRSALSDSSMAAVKLANDITVTGQIEVNRAVAIDGNNHEINVGAAVSWSGANGHKNLVCVHADNVTIQNITLENQNSSGTKLSYGLQGYKVTGMVLENVTILNSKGTGLTVNGSSVTATGLTISGSDWFQSIDVSKGSGVTANAALTLDSADGLSDTNKIIEDKAASADVTVGGKKWYAQGVLITHEDPSKNYFKYIYSADVTEAENGQIVVSAGSEETLREALENGAGKIILTADITLQEALALTASVTIDGNGHMLTSGSGVDRVLNITNVTQDMTVSLKNLDIVGPTSGTYTRGISLYNNTGVITLELENCSVSANYYAINVASANESPVVRAVDSTLSGWCAFQTHSPNTQATFTNCTLTGLNDKSYNADGWNDFATFVINGYTQGNPDPAGAHDCVLTLDRCRIEAEQTTGNQQLLFSVRTMGAKVYANACTFVSDGEEIDMAGLGDYVGVDSEEIGEDLVFEVSPAAR